jgi:hypothetical protein
MATFMGFSSENFGTASSFFYVVRRIDRAAFLEE